LRSNSFGIDAQLIDIDFPKIVIMHLVRRDHPSLKFRIPKASTAQIAALHPHIGKDGVRKISSSAIRAEKGGRRYLAMTQFCAV
jgi:hypothetical protein